MKEFFVTMVSLCIGSAAIALWMGISVLILYMLYVYVEHLVYKWKNKWHQNDPGIQTIRNGSLNFYKIVIDNKYLLIVLYRCNQEIAKEFIHDD